ncbi:MAG TPA: hypothetical protein VHT53_12320 [Candidatus Elarobacter sp.]|jgi:hypothetical protein|nr:hypothetical protein [Candidatus Elarobacter sp.]
MTADRELAAYQRALAAALGGAPVDVPGVERRGVAALAEIALRKRLAAVRAQLPATSAALGRAGFDARYRAFARGRAPCGAEAYRREAIAFARTLGLSATARDARALMLHDLRARVARLLS